MISHLFALAALAAGAARLPSAPAQEAAQDTVPISVPISPTGAAPAVAPASAAPTAPQVPQTADELASYYEGALLDSHNGEDFAETPGYRRMLEQLALYGVDELREKSTGNLDIPAALAAPDAWRGRIVHVSGIVAGIEAIKLATPLGEHVDAFRATVVDSEGVVVDFLAQPPELELQRDVVDVVGVFYRTVRYENRKGEVRDAPYLIARELRRVDTSALPRSPGIDSIGWVMIGAALVFLVVRGGMALRRHSSAGTRRDAGAAARAIRERAAIHSGATRPPRRA